MLLFHSQIRPARFHWFALGLLPLLLFLKAPGHSPRRVDGSVPAPAAPMITQTACPVADTSPIKPAPIDQDFSGYLARRGGDDDDVRDLLDRNTLLTARYDSDAKCAIQFWDLNTGKVKAQIVPPTSIESRTLQVSPDGSHLLAIGGDPNIYGWDLPSRRLTVNINVGDNREERGAFINPREPNEIMVTDSGLPDPQQDGKVTRYDLHTGTVKAIIPCPDAWRIVGGYALFSPDGKYLVDFDEPGEGDGQGEFEVFDPHTYRTIIDFDGEKEGRTIDSPVFFIDNDKLVLNTTLYNFTTHRATSVLPHHQHLHGECLASVPGRPGYALFLIRRGNSKRHFELWNTRSNTVIHRWSLTRRPSRMIGKPDAPRRNGKSLEVEYAFVSRDRQAFGFMDDQGVFRVYDYNFNVLPEASSHPRS